MTESAEEQKDADSGFWPDETVDAVAAFVVFSAVVLGLLWYVMNG